MMSDSERAYRIVTRIVSVGFALSILVWAGVGEYLVKSGYFQAQREPLLDANARGILELICVVLTVGAVVLGLLIKRAVISGRPAAMLTVVKALMRNAHRRYGATGRGIVLVPLALAELVAVLGFLLFFAGGGVRTLFYPFLVVALLLLAAVLPNRQYDDRVGDLDREITGERE